MSRQIGDQLSEAEIDDYLKQSGLGVLGFASEGEAYTIPIAFAFDGDRCIFRFLMGQTSEKRDFLADTETASLTVYSWMGKNEWRSVVVRGPLRELPDEELTLAATRFSEVGEEAALEIFNQPISEMDSAWYELRIEEKDGRGAFS
jgi:nitroimidazol reductase NimA-like FMN-containing flavoprotein (pyridoxamine 5'-phosphate oxidase superfamily)